MDILKLEEIIDYKFNNNKLLEEASNLSDRLINFGKTSIDYIIDKNINEELYGLDNITEDSINNLCNYLKSDDYLLERADKIHLDTVIYDRKIDLLKAVIAAYILDSDSLSKVEIWLNIFDSIVLNLDSDNNYAKKVYSWNKIKYKKYPNITFNNKSVSIKLDEIDTEFKSNLETRFRSINEASKTAYDYLESNNLLLKMSDVVGYPDQDKCINQLQELYVKGFINEPIYKISMKGTTPNGIDMWKCRIMIDGIKESFSAEDTSKKNVKRVVAFQMLKYLMNL